MNNVYISKITNFDGENQIRIKWVEKYFIFMNRKTQYC